MSKIKAPRDLTQREERSKYRLTVEWKRFREGIIETKKGCCEMCGQRYYGKQKKALQLHHLNPAKYNNLDPKDFKLLCGACHDIVEKFALKLKGSKKDMMANKEKWIDLLRDYLPYDVILDKEVVDES